MRSWLTGCLAILAVAGWTASGSAQTTNATKVVTVTVSESGFFQGNVLVDNITIRKGWTIHWVSSSGAFTILSGTPDDPANQGKLFNVAVVDKDTPVDQVVTLDLGKYDFFVQGMPNLRGTLTVQEATPINPTTWGFLKKMFEN